MSVRFKRLDLLLNDFLYHEHDRPAKPAFDGKMSAAAGPVQGWEVERAGMLCRLCLEKNSRLLTAIIFSGLWYVHDRRRL
jgi:hypothetical protein